MCMSLQASHTFTRGSETHFADSGLVEELLGVPSVLHLGQSVLVAGSDALLGDVQLLAVTCGLESLVELVTVD